MKLTKKLESEILTKYDSYWDSYFKGDMKTFAKLLDDNCHIIGSTEFDIFKNKKSAVGFYTSTADQITGKADFRNRKITVIPSGENVMIEEFCDFYFLANDEWKFYGHCRLSTLFSEKETGWKIIYQHGSMPDSKAQEGEQIAAKEVAEENKKLRNAIKRRTVELESKNRELEIEAALERVRATTMAMQKQDDLLMVLDILVEQLLKLGVNLQVANFSNGLPGGDWDLWIEVVADANNIFNNHVHFPRIDHPYFHCVEKNIETYRKDGTDLFKDVFTKEEKDSWQDYVNTHTIYKDLSSKEVRQSLYEKPGYNWSMVILKDTWVSICRFDTKPFSDEEDALLRRFANAFGQTYTRFLDLQKAEAQAREAQIELSLERVRAKTMALHKSADLIDVINVLADQFQQLGFKVHVANFNKNYQDKDWHLWLWALGRVYPHQITVPYFDHPYFNKIRETLDKGLDFNASVFTKDEKDSFLQNFYNVVGDESSEERKQFVFSTQGFAWSVVYLKNTSVTIANYDAQPYTDEQNSILRRFGNVFEQSYTRFLDLQKAEAQAEEAHVESALEKLRSTSLAMHKSEELQLVVNALEEKFKELGMEMDPADSVSIGVYKKGVKDFEYWIAGPYQPRTSGYRIPHGETPMLKEVFLARESDADSLCKVFSFEEKNESFKYFFDHTELRYIPDERKKFILAAEACSVAVAFSKHSWIQIVHHSKKLFNEEKLEKLKRFARVFDQAYVRFLDLQKAEAQSRESQIQLALERVRARTMAMQKSDELSDAVYILFQQFKELGENPDQATIGIINEDEKVIDYWVTMHGNPINKLFKFSLDEPNVTNKIYHAWKENKKSLVIDLTGDSLIEFMKYRAGKGGAAVNAEEKRRIINVAFFSKGLLNVQSNEERSEESIKLLERFASVFEQTYTRFLDLQNAEAQAREAKIETALEKVRSRTMAMFKSDELADAAATVFHQLQMLGIHNLRRSLVGIMNEEEGVWDVWYTTVEGESFAKFLKMPVDGHPIASEMKVRWLERKMIHVELAGDKLITWIKFIIASGWQYPKGEKPPDKFVIYGLPFSSGYLVAFTNDNISPSEIELLQRFARVFDQTYTRFLDLQKAEAQARESQIQLALERVRARTMAMQRSEELSETSFVLFQQFAELGIVPNRFFIGIVNEDERNFDIWLTEWGGKLSSQNFKVNIEEPVLLKKVYEAWKRKDKSIVVDIHDEDIINWNQYLEGVGLSVKNRKLVSRLVNTCANFSKGFIAITTPEITTDETVKLLERFASVFDGTYTRFLDLKNAEAQAREATIEAGLERVRGKAMAMHTSRDLAETIKVFYHEMELLSVTPRRCGVGLLNRKTRIVELSTMNTTEEGNSIEIIGRINMVGHPVLEGIYDNWLQQKEYQPVLRGNEIKDYYKLLRPQISYPDYPNDAIQFGYFFYFPEGGVYAWTNKELGDDELKIYRRFTSVLSLTYKRYKDLMDSEARAKEAIKQASLDRVRGEIASMRSTEDLQRITPLIFKELTALGVPFFRCGVFIINEPEKIVHAYLSAPDGHSLAVLNLSFDSNELTTNSVKYWRKGMVYHQHWNKEEFMVWTQSMITQGQIQNRQTYQGAAAPPDNLDLHFVPFTQGMLYVGNSAHLNEDEIALVKSLAQAFSIAYSRYEDFTKLEHAKQSIENTLIELRATQKQLIQSEKMASLGELTAGIAHEIQNPLNFVNNFSEVNKEMLEELKAERLKPKAERDEQTEDEIINDVIGNSEKINQHGKRAGDIVKGMLQHSRSSTGVKEPTDINALVDEYLRLSYHGLRAKNKSFNATMKTDFDEKIGKINIIPQDIGRVLLNLFNNAFYAVNEKAKLLANSYQPTASVTTRKSNNHVIITVSDNGNGVPEKVKDKIFQPFFTTKPTGQGTGLGLSLSYDIVKAHNGEIKLNTKEGEGSEFIIQLPTN